MEMCSASCFEKGAQERTIISVFKNGLLLVNSLIHKLLVLYYKC